MRCGLAARAARRAARFMRRCTGTVGTFCPKWSRSPTIRRFGDSGRWWPVGSFFMLASRERGPVIADCAAARQEQPRRRSGGRAEVLAVGQAQVRDVGPDDQLLGPLRRAGDVVL